jgi:hypothetical protein
MHAPNRACVPLENLEVSEQMGIILSIRLSSDAHRSYDTPSHSVFYVSFSSGA